MAVPAAVADIVRSPKCSAVSLAAMHSPFYIDWRGPNPKLPRCHLTRPAVPCSGVT